MPTAALRLCKCGAVHPCPAHTHKRWTHTTTRQQRGYGTAWDKARAQQLKRQPYCDCGRKATHVDHMVPKYLGGTDDPSNLQSMCRGCEATKTAQDGNRAKGAKW